MRPKHYAALALLAWLAVVGWVGSMVAGKPRAFVGGFGDADAVVAGQIQLEIQRVEQVRTALQALAAAAPPPAQAAGVVAEPPPMPGTEDGAGPGTALAAVSRPGDRVVSLILSGASIATRAIVDGRMVGPGTRLDDGAIVRSIGPRSVRIEEADGTQRTLALRTPGDPPPAAAEGTP
ncbi:MAG TPA: hypothetical protein DCM32_02980 [Xanthomonadaceae bacterium]|jgi:hypothetical protein|nr:hypothetical protein [Xanthomonadaceae bacterium]